MRHLLHNTKQTTRWTLAVLVLLLTACDAEDSPNDKGAALYNMSYRISNISDEVPTENLRAAVIWTYSSNDGGIAGISRDIPIGAEFPSSFSLEISELPPAEAMEPIEAYAPIQGDFDCGGMPDPEVYTPEEIEQIIEEEGIVPCPEETDERSGVKWAVGRMVVYSDTNNNGELDTLGPDATLDTIIDQIVGPTENLIIMYFEGTPTGTDLVNDIGLSGITTGFNLLQGIESEEWEYLTEGYNLLDINTEIPITLSIKEGMQSLMCEEPIEGPRDSSVATLSTFITSVDQAPADATLSCSTDGLTATFSKVIEVTEATMCTSYASEGEEWIMILDAREHAPADWPCTIPQ